MNWGLLFAMFVLFPVGLRLSAFFSGSETGFYRVSIPRLTIDAQAGDPVAQRLLWFARNPASFLSTTLVGNNLANYLTSFAVSMSVVRLIDGPADLWEVLATILISPVVYLFGELLPKNLYYRAPMMLLRRDSTWFRVCYWLLLPASAPLLLVTRVLERFTSDNSRRIELVFGRSRLVQLLRQSSHEGVLSDVQNRLATGVLRIAPQRVEQSMISLDRILGIPENAPREQLLKFAARHGISHVAIRRPQKDGRWFAYVRVMDVLRDSGPLPRLFQTMPVIAPGDGKLDALQQLQVAAKDFGLVQDGDRVLGIVSSRELSEQLFESSLATGHAG